MTDDELLGYAFDTLEYSQQDRIEQQLERDPLARARLEEVRRITRFLAEDDAIENPPGLAAKTLSLIQRADRIVERPEWPEQGLRLRALDFAVVASVLCITAVLVFPAIATIRGDQARLQCADRLRQLGIAMALYAEQEAQQLPFVSTSGPLNNAGSFTVALKARDLIPDLTVLICPSANNGVVMVPEPEQVNDLVKGPNTQRLEGIRRNMSGSYGYQLGYDEFGGYHGRKASRSQTAIVSDRPPRWDEMLISTNSPNHQYQGQNVLLADGGVRWLPTSFMGNDNLFLNSFGVVAAGANPGDVVIGVSEATPHPSSQAGL